MNGETAFDGAGEADKLDLCGLNEFFDLLEVAAVEVLNYVLVEAGLNEEFLDLLCNCWGLRRWLENDAIAS